MGGKATVLAEICLHTDYPCKEELWQKAQVHQYSKSERTALPPWAQRVLWQETKSVRNHTMSNTAHLAFIQFPILWPFLLIIIYPYACLSINLKKIQILVWYSNGFYLMHLQNYLHALSLLLYCVMFLSGLLPTQTLDKSIIIALCIHLWLYLLKTPLKLKTIPVPK